MIWYMVGWPTPSRFCLAPPDPIPEPINPPRSKSWRNIGCPRWLMASMMCCGESACHLPHALRSGNSSQTWGNIWRDVVHLVKTFQTNDEHQGLFSSWSNWLQPADDPQSHLPWCTLTNIDYCNCRENKCKYINPNIPVLYINAVGWIELRVKSRSLFSFWLGNINSSQFEEGTVGMIFSLGEKKVFTVDMSWNANEAQTSRAHLLLPVLSLWPPNQQWSAIY